MIIINLCNILMRIASFANNSYWLLCMCFWGLYFPSVHTLFHEVCHVRAALRFGCNNHQIIIYNHHEEKNIFFFGIPVLYTTESDGLKQGKSCYSPRSGLSEFEKYCITRAGYHFDLVMLTVFFISAEIAIFPAFYTGDYIAFWSLTALVMICSYGYIGIQFFINDTDLYKMRLYKAHEAQQLRKSIAHQNIMNWRSQRQERIEIHSDIIDYHPYEYTVSNASGLTQKNKKQD